MKRADFCIRVSTASNTFLKLAADSDFRAPSGAEMMYLLLCLETEYNARLQSLMGKPLFDESIADCISEHVIGYPTLFKSLWNDKQTHFFRDAEGNAQCVEVHSSTQISRLFRDVWADFMRITE